MIELVRETYRYRELIWALALKELKIRYKRSMLGFLWALLNPALLMLVLTLVFSTLLRFPIPHYAIFLLSVLLPWTFFSQSLSYAVESIGLGGYLAESGQQATGMLCYSLAPVQCTGTVLQFSGIATGTIATLTSTPMSDGTVITLHLKWSTPTSTAGSYQIEQNSVVLDCSSQTRSKSAPILG